MNFHFPYFPLDRAVRGLSAAALAAALAACGGGGDGDSPQPDPGPQQVAIEFAAMAHGAPVRCGSALQQLGAHSVAAELRDLRFYVSDVQLIDRQGNRQPLQLDVNEWQLPELALVDLEDGSGACADAGTAATSSRITGQVPQGDYAGLTFRVGVPGSLNHSDTTTAAPPLDLQALSWSWQSGRKFLQVEVNPAGGVVRPAPAAPGKTFFVHLGSTGCTGNPVTGETVSCERPNRMDVVLDTFDAQTQKVVLDVAALLAGSDLNRDLGSSPGCMSGMADPECAAVFERLGLDLSAGTPLGGNLQQSVFRAEAR